MCAYTPLSLLMAALSAILAINPMDVIRVTADCDNGGEGAELFTHSLYRRSVFNCEYLLIANCEYFLRLQLIDSQT